MRVRCTILQVFRRHLGAPDRRQQLTPLLKDPIDNIVLLIGVKPFIMLSSRWFQRMLKRDVSNDVSPTSFSETVVCCRAVDLRKRNDVRYI